MRPAVLQRLFALAGLALIAAVVALAATRNDSDSRSSSLPAAAPAPGGGWFEARAAPEPVPPRPRRTVCGHEVTAETLGVAHPVLPCNVQIYIEFGHKQVLTQVIARGPVAQGSEFGVTGKLATEIGLHGIQQIKWRFAAAER